ncbi:MAG: ATP-dependent zinc protease [Planctomycetota bacterium]
MSREDHVLVGWSERVGLPEWGIASLRAKIDTGARSSALHVEDLRFSAPHMADFVIVAGREHRRIGVHCAVARWARVTSSNGHYQRRPFVRTVLRLGPLVRTVEISLVDRGDLRFPMLIGRTALAGAYIVDPNRRRVASPPRRRRTTPGRH